MIDAASAPAEHDSAKASPSGVRNQQGPQSLEASKVTLYVLGAFGTRRIEASHVKVWTGRYAQFEAAVFVEYVPKGGRRAREFVETDQPRLLVLDGYRHPDERDRLNRDGSGNPRVRLTSCAPEWTHGFDRDFAPYLADLGARVLADYRRHDSRDRWRMRRAAAGPFTADDRVRTPQGPGVVVYRRMAPPDFRVPQAYSVRLDGRDHVGSIFPAEDVTAEEVEA